MIGAISILVIGLFVPTHEQSTTTSPCPNVFMYEPSGTEAGRWYGVVNLSTDSTLHSLWLNIVLDSKADILGNWIGDVTTSDNTDFKIENTKMKIHPGPAVAVRFFVQYNPLNKAPRLSAIRLNGREICNAKTPQPAIDVIEAIRPDPTAIRPGSDSSRPVIRTERPLDRQTERPIDRPVDRPSNTQTKPIIRPEDKPITKPVFGRPSGDGPVYIPTSNPPIDQSNVNPYSIGGGQVPDQSVIQSRPTFQLTTASYSSSTPDDEDNDSSEADPSEYFNGGQLLVTPVPDSNGHNNRPKSDQCGKVLRNNPNPLVVNGKPTLEGQWPWQIALYQTQTVDSKYICGGTLVSHKHVITAAHCVTRKGSSRTVNKNTLTIYLGKHNLRTSVEGVEIRLVGEITVHPEYNASSFSRDLSILRLRKAVDYTEFIRAACLWPDNQIELNNVIGKKGAVVGWGFDETGVATEELTLVEMPVVDQETCIRSYSEFFARFTSEYTYCAGYRDGTSVCNGDSGGGMVFELQGSWYLRGLVSLSVARQNEYRCDPTHYVVFTDLAKFLSWIKQHDQCGKVLRNNPYPLILKGIPTMEGQWPWQIALYQTEYVDNRYICGGTLVSHKHVITAAHCVTRKGTTKKVNKNILTIYLGKHNLRTSFEGVEIRFVEKITVHPEYNGSSFSHDLSILGLRKAVNYTEFIRAACLWPESQVDLTNVIGKKGSVVGWGFDETGMMSETLNLVEMPVVDQETCIGSYSTFFARFTSEYTYCAGYRDGSSVCNGDSGGGMVFELKDSWYLRGLVSISVPRQKERKCDPTHYVVFTDLAKFLSWIKQNLNNY